MMRGIFLWILVFLVSLVSVVAFPNPDVSLEPTEFYETNNVLFNLTINNLFKNEVIHEISVHLNSLNFTNVVDFLGWENNFTNKQINWFSGDIETNSITLFQFRAQAGLVNSNVTENITIIVTNETGSETIINIPITIIEDTTPPVILDLFPEDGSLIREGIEDQPIYIEAEDSETGIKEAFFSYWNCTDNITTTIVLNCTGNLCQNSINFSEYQEGDYVCFEFIVFNNALGNTTANGNFTFDGTAPSVSLIGPNNNSYGNNETIFSFIAVDNLANSLSCDLVFDNLVIDTVSVLNNVTSNVVYNLSNVSEGSYSWKINCTDGVGLSNTSETRIIIIDLTPPVITLISPLNNSVLNDNVIIDILVTDNYEVANITYSSSLNTSEMPEGINIIQVNATDGAGNRATKNFTFTIDRTSPTINLITPLNNDDVDVNINFTFLPDDNLATFLDCSLYINNSLNYTNSFLSGNVAIIYRLIPMGHYTWHIVCDDEAGNSVQSEVRNLNVTDLTGPEINSDIIYVSRGVDYIFEINVTDISGIENVTVFFNGTLIPLTQIGDIYSGEIKTNISFVLGNYSLNITAYDTLGNKGNLIDEFELVPSYLMVLSLNPNPVTVNNQVLLSGTVQLDDNSEIPENNITIDLFGNIIILNVNNKLFNHTFNAPGSVGNYDVEAEITSSHGFTYTEVQTLNVVSSGVSSSSSRSSSSGGGGRVVGYCGDGVCNRFENCERCPEDCGVCPELRVIQEEVKTKESDGNYTSEEIEEDESRKPFGTGAGTGLFRALLFNPLSIVLFLIVITLLLIFSYNRKKVIYIK